MRERKRVRERERWARRTGKGRGREREISVHGVHVFVHVACTVHVAKSCVCYECFVSVSVAQNHFPDFLVSGVVPLIQEGVEGYNLVSFKKNYLSSLISVVCVCVRVCLHDGFMLLRVGCSWI